MPDISYINQLCRGVIASRFFSGSLEKLPLKKSAADASLSRTNFCDLRRVLGQHDVGHLGVGARCNALTLSSSIAVGGWTPTE